MKSILRWVIFLPTSLIAGYLAWLAVTFLNRWSMEGVGVDPDSFVAHAFIEYVSNLVMGAACVFVAAKIAPSHRVLVAFLMAGLVILGAGFALFPAITTRNYWAMFADGAFALGAGAVVWSVYLGEIPLDHPK